jgi:hypothetical protein
VSNWFIEWVNNSGFNTGDKTNVNCGRALPLHSAVGCSFSDTAQTPLVSPSVFPMLDAVSSARHCASFLASALSGVFEIMTHYCYQSISGRYHQYQGGQGKSPSC